MSKVIDINNRAPYTPEQLDRVQSNLERSQYDYAARRYIALKVAERREFRRDMVLGFLLTLGAIMCLLIGWNL
jgi:hypothetical protein